MHVGRVAVVHIQRSQLVSIILSDLHAFVVLIRCRIRVRDNLAELLQQRHLLAISTRLAHLRSL